MAQYIPTMNAVVKRIPAMSSLVDSGPVMFSNLFLIYLYICLLQLQPLKRLPLL